MDVTNERGANRRDNPCWRLPAIAYLLPFALVASGALAQGAGKTAEDGANTPEQETNTAERMMAAQKEIKLEAKVLDNYVGHYLIGGERILTLSRDGDRLFVTYPGRAPQQVFAQSAQKFFYKLEPVEYSFTTDAQGKATEVVAIEPGTQEVYKRLDEATAERLKSALSERIKTQVATPGGEEALKRHIEAIRKGEPLYSELQSSYQKAMRRSLSDNQRSLAELGALQSLTFLGVGSQGFDVYETKFANGIAICRLVLTSDGKVAELMTQFGP